MEHLLTIGLLDSDGQPFDPRIQRVLIQLLPRLRREFPTLQDEVGLAEIMEEAAESGIVKSAGQSGDYTATPGSRFAALRCRECDWIHRS